MNNKKSTMKSTIPSTPPKSSNASQTPSPVKSENNLTPSKRVKTNEIIQIGVVGSSEHGHCAIEVKNGYSV